MRRTPIADPIVSVIKIERLARPDRVLAPRTRRATSRDHSRPGFPASFVATPVFSVLRSRVSRHLATSTDHRGERWPIGWGGRRCLKETGPGLVGSAMTRPAEDLDRKERPNRRGAALGGRPPRRCSTDGCPGMNSYSSSRCSKPSAAEISPAGSVRNSPASDAPKTSRSNRSDDDRAGEMNAAAAGVIEPVPKGFTGTQPSTAVTQTTWPEPFVVVSSPSDMRAGDIVLDTVSSVPERWYCANASHRQMWSPSEKSPRSPTVLPSVERSNAKLRRPSSSTRRAMPPEMRALTRAHRIEDRRVVDEQRAHVRSQHRVGGVVAHFEVRVRSGQDGE